MFRNRILLKTFATFFILEMLASTIAPIVSYALTAGPTAPEATSFEPVDTTDMVNLATGDLVYNIPLLEVPGPSGGYPLSLSYHAGIMPGEEASWVGLGWTLNPGAISRTINGFPDDFNGVTSYDRVYWKGGTTDTYSIGVTIGMSGLQSVSAGLHYSEDTYKGAGWGGYLGVGIGWKGSPLSINAGVGINPYGGWNANIGLSFRPKDAEGNAIGISTSVGLVTNFESVGANLSASFKNMDLSISTTDNGIQTSMSVAGIRGRIYNSKVGILSIHTNELGLSIPVLPFVSISIGYNHTRYWMDQTEAVKTYGALYNPKMPVNSFDLNAYDTYTLPLDASDDNPNMKLGPSFFNYDRYNVSAQGLGGSMRPYSFKNLLFRQNRKLKNGDYEIKQFPYNSSNYQNERIQFRFENDFANRYQAIDGTWTNQGGPLYADFGTVTTGESGSNGILEGHLIGSNATYWYTNEEILNGQSLGLIEPTSFGFDRTLAPLSQIGGFKIVNKNGVTYHFALPVYAYDEYQYSENTKESSGSTYNEYKKPTPYAYAWFLTAITGPDFVDRGGLNNESNGKLDENDWGYWVEFQYGKWTNTYAWRNPPVGYDIDIDNNFKNYASGKKEIYYLDIVRTSSHTAIFSKSLRIDSKSSAVAMDLQKHSDLGFTPSLYNSTIKSKEYEDESCEYKPKDYTTTKRDYNHLTYPVSLLKLDSVYLFENSELKRVLTENNIPDLNSLRTQGDSHSFFITGSLKTTIIRTSWRCCDFIPENPSQACTCSHCEYNGDAQVSDSLLEIPLHLGDNIIDVDDIIGITNFKKKSLRRVSLHFDYSLTPETTNSFSHANLYTTTPPNDQNQYSLNGKLTLKKLTFLGKDNAYLPPMLFNYELELPVSGTSNLYKSDGKFFFNSQSAGLVPGDIITFSSNGLKCFALIATLTGSVHGIKLLGKNTPSTGIINWITTKNPPYNKDHHDQWNLYKPDFDIDQHKNLSRVTTPIGALNVDVWSLRSVLTSYGSKIIFEYESDSYNRTVLQESHSFIVKAISVLSCESTNPNSTPIPSEDYIQDPFLWNEIPETINCLYQLEIENEGIDLRTLFHSGQVIECILPYSYQYLYETSPGNYSSNRIDTYASQIQLTSVNKDNVRGNIFLVAGSTLYGAAIFYKYTGLTEIKGGGYRVKSVTVKDQLRSTTRSTIYNYNFGGVSSGVTSYEPNVFDKIKLTGANKELEKIAAKEMKSRMLSQVIKFTREVPTPGVMYKHVTTTEVVGALNEIFEVIRTEYEFEVLSKNMIGHTTLSLPSGSGGTYMGTAYDEILRRDITLKDYTSWIGQPKCVRMIDKNGKLLFETKYHFLNDLLTSIESMTSSQMAAAYESLYQKFIYQGLIQETTWDARFVKQSDNNLDLYGIISRRHVYQSVPLGETSVNYKTGVITTSTNLAFDFYSGQVVKTLSTDGYGNSYITETTPAYRIPTYSSGMSFSAAGGKNMLTQEAASYTFKVVPENPQQPISNTNYRPIGLVGASVQTWSDQLPVVKPGENTSQHLYQTGIWRKHESYSFVGDDNTILQADGLYPLVNNQLPVFNSWQHDRYQVKDVPPNWQRNSEITLYDVYSHALEAKDVNRLYAATKMSLDQTKVFATVANAEYREFAFSGAEEPAGQDGLVGGGVYINGTKVPTAHTGKEGVSAATGLRAFTYYMVPRQRNYLVSVWASQPDVTIKYRLDNTGQPITTTVQKMGQASAWYLHQAVIPITEAHDNLEIWCEAKNATTVFDDFRVCPVDAAMTSYVYNEWGELSHILDNNNLFTRYEYDGMGRLTRTFKETFIRQGDTPAYGNQGIVLVSEINYNYGANSTFTVPFEASAAGMGNIYPSGTIQIKQGTEFNFSLQGYCPVAVQQLYIDGLPINLAQAEHTLYDGSKIKITGTGNARLIAFKGIQGGHKIHAVFNSANQEQGGVAYCQTSTYDNGGQTITCYTGYYVYRTLDDCGLLGPPVVVSDISQIPGYLQHLVSECQNDCPY